MIERPYVTLQEAAAILRCSPDALRMRIARGQLRAYRPSRRIVYLRRDELMDYVEKASLPPVARRLACAVCHLESGTRVMPLTTRRPTNVTLRKGADGELRCQFCWVPEQEEE